MNPSSLGIDFSAVQRQKDIYNWIGNQQFVEEGWPNTIENISGVRQQVTSSFNDSLTNY